MPAADAYVPGHGNRRFGVRAYDLDLDYRIATNHLSGRAVLEIEAAEPLDQVALDLYGLTVTKVKVGGRPARFTHRDRKLRIALASPVKAGSRLSVEIDYAGKPRPMPSVFGPVGWEELTDGVLVGTGGLAGLFSPFAAWVFLVFTLLYTPCVAAIATVKRESGGRNALYTVVTQCVIAWCVAFLVRCLGGLFGLS
mgnify:CR=1 FL=1